MRRIWPPEVSHFGWQKIAADAFFTLVGIRRKAQEAGVLIFPAEAANPRSTTSFQNGDQDGLAVNSSPRQLEFPLR